MVNNSSVLEISQVMVVAASGMEVDGASVVPVAALVRMVVGELVVDV